MCSPDKYDLDILAVTQSINMDPGWLSKVCALPSWIEEPASWVLAALFHPKSLLWERNCSLESRVFRKRRGLPISEVAVVSSG
jgi:hypothetical protein